MESSGTCTKDSLVDISDKATMSLNVEVIGVVAAGAGTPLELVAAAGADKTLEGVKSTGSEEASEDVVAAGADTLGADEAIDEEASAGADITEFVETTSAKNESVGKICRHEDGALLEGGLPG